MLSYLTIGANDVNVSAAFYRAILVPLGFEEDAHGGAVRFSLAGTLDRDNGPGTVWVQKPFDGGPAVPANGMMPAFRAASAELVRACYAAGLVSGGSDEGAPGTRSYYSDTFFVAYLRDPVGNKGALFCVLTQ